MYFLVLQFSVSNSPDVQDGSMTNPSSPLSASMISLSLVRCKESLITQLCPSLLLLITFVLCPLRHPYLFIALVRQPVRPSTAFWNCEDAGKITASHPMNRLVDDGGSDSQSPHPSKISLSHPYGWVDQ